MLSWNYSELWTHRVKCCSDLFTQMYLIKQSVKKLLWITQVFSPPNHVTKFHPSVKCHMTVLRVLCWINFYSFVLTGCGLKRWSAYGCLCKIFQAGRWWVDEFLKKTVGCTVIWFCTSCVTCYPPSLQHLVSLFARLANDNIGYIDWDPYIPKVCCPVFLNIHSQWLL